ncbi:Hypothetical protein HVR_LOCUS1316 [uncultured virus]|nr:Hypothetical protein HVR_LOCUS1316 [uncultured virus]
MNKIIDEFGSFLGRYILPSFFYVLSTIYFILESVGCCSRITAEYLQELRGIADITSK